MEMAGSTTPNVICQQEIRAHAAVIYSLLVTAPTTGGKMKVAGLQCAAHIGGGAEEGSLGEGL